MTGPRVDLGNRSLYLLAQTQLDRLAYRSLLGHELGLAVAVDSAFAPPSIWTAMRSKPAIAMVVADQPSIEVRDAIAMIPRLCKATRVLVLSGAVEPGLVQNWGQVPIHGYVIKDGGLSELRTALAAFARDQDYYSDGVADLIHRGRTRQSGAVVLSRRESELLPLLARGMTLRDAAARMSVSYKTADSYRTSLLRKLGVRDRVGLARYAIRERIIDA